MKPTRIAVIGIGHLGKIHTKLWRDLAKEFPEALHLSALYTLDRAHAEACIRDLDIHSALGYTPHICDRLQDVFNLADAVTIVTTTSTHFAIAQECLLAGKHCFIEKPITTTANEAKILIEYAQTSNLIIHVGHVERYNPAVQALRQADLSPRYIEARRMAQFTPRATDVSVILDLMIHDIDLALWLVSSPVVDVRASGVNVLTHTTDMVNARLECANGAVLNLTASRLAPHPMRTMQVFGKDSFGCDSCFSLDFTNTHADIFTLAPKDAILPEGAAKATMLGNIETAQKADEKMIWHKSPVVAPVNAIQEEQRAFLRAIRTIPIYEPSISATGEDALAAMLVAERIQTYISEAEY